MKNTKTRRITAGACGLVLLLALATSVWAHDTWLMARSGFVQPGTRASLDLTSGMAFPALDYAIKADRIERARLRLAGQTSPLAAPVAGPKSLRFSVRFAAPGVATLWVELKPKALELTPEKVTEYLEEIGAPDSLQRVWRRPPAGARWREIYTKHAKTFVRVGTPRGDRSGEQPVGMALEIVPESDPTALRRGDTLRVRVLEGGQPLAGFPLGIVAPGNRHGRLQNTDADGRVIIPITRAGAWLLRGTRLTPSSQAGTDWESHFTTATFYTRPQATS